MALQIGILIFDGAEELDFVGPYEVFTMAGMGEEKIDVQLISETGADVTCAKGMVVKAHHSIASAPGLDVLLIPGGEGTRREVKNEGLCGWIAETAKTCQWVTSVCTGSMVLVAAGPARGKTVTTHWSMCETLAAQGQCTVLKDRRYVRDGNLVTAAGVSAGIDMALWLIGQIYSPDHARTTQHFMEYDPAPPYAAAV